MTFEYDSAMVLSHYHGVSNSYTVLQANGLTNETHWDDPYWTEDVAMLDVPHYDDNFA